MTLFKEDTRMLRKICKKSSFVRIICQ